MSALQNLFANLTPSKALKGLVCVLSSLSLTAYVDLFALNSVWSRLLVFGCFLAAWAALFWAAGRLSKSAPPQGTVLLAVAAALLIVVGCRDAFFPSAQETFITLISETAGEICLCDVVVDGENIPVAKAEVVENSGWLYREQYDNFMIWPEEDGVENRLTMRFFAKEVHVGFPYTPYAGSVTITSSAGRGGGTWDLRCPEWEEGEAVQYADFPIDCRRVYTPLVYLVYGSGILAALSVFCLIVLLVWQKYQLWFSLLPEKRQRMNRRSLPDTGRRIQRPQPDRRYWSLPDLSSPRGVRLSQICFVLLLVAHYLLFFTSPQIAPDRPTSIFLALLAATSYLCLFSERGCRLLKEYRTRGGTVSVVVIALYASLASFGQRFFLDGNTRMHITAEGLGYVILGTVWFIPIICLLLFVLELLASRCRPRTGPARRRQVFWGLLVILCLCQAVVLWSFWPGGFPSDCIDQMNQAVGHGFINNWHPALHTILYRVILTVCPHAGALVAVQLFFFALLCTEFLMLGYDHGLSFKVLAVLGVGVSLLPNQVIFSISPLKDYPYTLALLWTTYLLVRLALDPGEVWRWRFLGALSLSLFLVYGFRHNGIVPFAALLLLFLWITLRHFPKVKLQLAEAGLAAVLLVAVYKGPVFSSMNISGNTGMSRYTTMLCAVGSCINKGLPLSEESTAIMESILPLDQWGTYYDRYLGHDPYYWGRGELAAAYPFDPSHVTAKEAFTVYLEALCKYPDVVIKDRLDGMDLLWDVRQPSDGINVKGFYGTIISEEDRVAEYFDFNPMEPGVHYYNQSRLAELYRGAVNTPTNNVLDMLLWRSGAYLILLMTLGLFWWGNRMKTLLWASVPLLGQLAGLMLVLYHQSYRYISAVQILTLALAFYSVCLRGVQAGGSHGEPPFEEPSSADGGEARG